VITNGYSTQNKGESYLINDSFFSLEQRLPTEWFFMAEPEKDAP